MGHVRELWLKGPAGRLEAALRGAPEPRGTVLLAHPHPLHGGTLHNPVVFHADRELNRAGLTTLRLNFRGVGRSEGTHDGGRGEVDDLAQAAGWLRGLTPERPLLVVGYSFGALCALRLALVEPHIRGVIAIGLPSRLDALEELGKLERPLVVVQGERDELGPPEELREHLERSPGPTSLRVVPGAS